MLLVNKILFNFEVAILHFVALKTNFASTEIIECNVRKCNYTWIINMINNIFIEYFKIFFLKQNFLFLKIFWNFIL